MCEGEKKSSKTVTALLIGKNNANQDCDHDDDDDEAEAAEEAEEAGGGGGAGRRRGGGGGEGGGGGGGGGEEGTPVLQQQQEQEQEQMQLQKHQKARARASTLQSFRLVAWPHSAQNVRQPPSRLGSLCGPSRREEAHSGGGPLAAILATTGSGLNPARRNEEQQRLFIRAMHLEIHHLNRLCQQAMRFSAAHVRNCSEILT